MDEPNLRKNKPPKVVFLSHLRDFCSVGYGAIHRLVLDQESHLDSACLAEFFTSVAAAGRCSSFARRFLRRRILLL